MDKPEKQYLGTHILVELYGCDIDILNDSTIIESEMRQAARAGNAHIINSNSHNFEPQGVSAVIIISESHLTIHTWPEYEYAAVDLFFCARSVDPWAVIEYLKKAFCADRTSSIDMKRGRINDMK